MHYLAMGDTAAAFTSKRAALNYLERVEAMLGICDTCGADVINLRTPRGKRVQLDPQLSTSYHPRFAFWRRDGETLADFCDGWDRAHNKAGYPLHKTTCRGKPDAVGQRRLQAREKYAGATVRLGPNRGFGKSDDPIEEVE